MEKALQNIMQIGAKYKSLGAKKVVYIIPYSPTKKFVEAFKTTVEDLHTAFNDWHISIDSLIGEGDKVVVQWSGVVTHTGNFLTVKPSNKEIKVCGTNIYHLKQGKILKEYEQTNSLSWLSQMGVL